MKSLFESVKGLGILWTSVVYSVILQPKYYDIESITFIEINK